ncbi:MAG: ATP-binding protein [Halobacteriales archaeon]|nr:ATP-binding protein [Halobacteriales archaeon]
MTDLGDFSEYEGDDAPAEAGGEPPVDAGAAPADESPPDQSPSFEPVDVSPAGQDVGIGTLATAQGLRIAEDGDETRLRAYVTVGNRSAVRIGTYLLAPYPDDETLFCRIAALEYVPEFHADDATEIHARRAMRSGGIDERDYKFMATLEPIAVLYPDDGELRRRMTDRVPKPETVVRRAADKSEIKTGLKIPAEGVFLGHLAVGGEVVRTAAEPPTIDYRLKDDYATGDPLVFRHTLVAGGTGSGKTHAAKNVLRQYLSEERAYPVESGASRTVRPAVVQFDPQDEYAQMHDDNPAATADDARRWEREGIAHGGHDDTVVLVPKVGNASYSASHHKAEQVEFTLPFSMVRENKWLVAGGNLNDNQYSALAYHLLPGFFEDYGDDGTYREFLDYLDDPTVKERLGTETGSGQVHEATFDAVKRRVMGGPFGQVFDQAAPPITELIETLVRPGGLTTVPTYHINNSRAAGTVVLGLASLLIDEKLSNDSTHDRISETPLVVGMDEAHNFLSSGDTAQARRVIGKFTEAAKQGRKERLGLFLVTQDPQDIADAVFKQVNTKLVLNLGDDDAISSMNLPTALAEKVPYMETGQLVVYSPDNSEPVELAGLSKCLTRHGRD